MAQEPRYSSHDGAYEPRYASYDDQYAEPVDLDEFGSQLRSYHPSRSIATREEFLPDDSVPLFLSGSDEDSVQRFGRLRRNRSRLLKTGILAIAASAAAFTVVAVKNPFTVFANATASLIGISDVRSAPATTTAAVQPIVGTRIVPPTSTQSPTRDEIAVALRTAHQSAAPAETAAPLAAVAPVVAAAPPVAPAPPPAVAPPVAAPPQVVATASPVAAPPPAVAAPPVVAAPVARKISPDELATLMSRARTLLAAGDLPSARLLLERAAEGQDANAALMLARTYDPLIMGTQDTRNTITDPELARTWYQRAAQLGSADAQRRLSQLQ
jgi:hypothetical protein